MHGKKIAILGAGISGLATAFFLKKRDKELSITLFEKETAFGGVIQSVRSEGIFFESGPRTFSSNRTPHLLALIKELGLENEVVFSRATKRFLLRDGKLVEMPSTVLDFVFSPLFFGGMVALWKDLRHPAKVIADETIYSFCIRHFGSAITETVIEPMVLGIFGGDYKTLSVSACFPKWKQLEYKYGSVMYGMYKTRKKKPLPPLYTLRNGMHTLIDGLKNTCGDVAYKGAVLEIDERESEVLVNGERFDHVFCAIPAQGAGRLVSSEYAPFFEKLPLLTITAVNLAFQKGTLPEKAFGYLVPTSEAESILGIVFDSVVFPDEIGPECIRLTVMLRGSDEPLKKALSAVKRHLGITGEPLQVRVHTYENALPQFGVDHLKRAEVLESKNISFVGNYLKSASVESCIAEADRKVSQFVGCESISRNVCVSK